MDGEFLPKGYQVPKDSGSYMKFKQGSNKFRILSSPILGKEGWTVDNKPVRVGIDQEVPKSNLKPDKKVKHFWAMPVYNYAENKIQILEITQVGIQEIIRDYANNEDWGTPLEYDLTVNRKGEKFDTEYSVIAHPKKDLNVIVKKLWDGVKEKGFDLHKLFTNENPFGDGDVQVVDDEPEINVDEIPL